MCPSYTVYCDPDPETSSVDGNITYTTDADFSTMRNAATGTSTNSTSTGGIMRVQAAATTDVYNSIVRIVHGFDLSAIDAAETVTAVVHSCWPTAKVDGFSGAGAVGFTGVTLASNIITAAGDYDGFASTRYCSDIDIGSITTGAYNDFTYNADGIAAVQAKLDSAGFNTMLRVGWDIDNSGPTWASAEDASLTVNMAENANGTARAPKLVITTTAGGSSIIPILAGLGYFSGGPN